MNENHMIFSDHERRLMELGGSFIAVEDGMVNIADLVGATSSRIVRCRKSPHEAIRVVHFGDGPIGCVAGWISEDE